MNTHQTAALFSTIVTLCLSSGCISRTNTLGGESARHAIESERQPAILNGTVHLDFSKDDCQALSSIFNEIRSVLKKTPDLDSSFDEHTGLFTYLCGKNRQTISISDICEVHYVHEGITGTSAHYETGNVRVDVSDDSNRDPDGLYLSTPNYLKLVYRIINGESSWVPCLCISTPPAADQQKLRDLFQKATNMKPLGPPSTKESKRS